MKEISRIKKENIDTPSDLLKYRSHVKFLSSDEGLVVVTATGYKWMRSKWIKPLHDKIYPFISRGCSKEQLFQNIGKDAQKALKLYLQALNKSNALINGKEQLATFQLAKSGNKLLTELFQNSFTVEEKIVIIKNESKKQLFAICSSQNIFYLLEKLAQYKKSFQMSVMLVSKDFQINHSFQKIFNWYFQNEPFVTGKNREISFFIWDEISFSSKLAFQTASFKQLKFRDLVDNFKLVSPLKNMAQLPLSILSLNTDENKKTVSLHYQSAAEKLIIQEITRQIGKAQTDSSLSEIDESQEVVIKKNIPVKERFFSAVSKAQLRAEFLDDRARNYHFSSQKESFTDILLFQSKHVSINYLQDIIRLKSSSLTVKRELLDDCFYRFSDDSFSTISLNEEKALHDFLLARAYCKFYPDEKVEEVTFYSNIMEFIKTKALNKRLMKIERKFFAENNFPPAKIQKVSGFLGTFYQVFVE